MKEDQSLDCLSIVHLGIHEKVVWRHRGRWMYHAVTAKLSEAPRILGFSCNSCTPMSYLYCSHAVDWKEGPQRILSGLSWTPASRRLSFRGPFMVRYRLASPVKILVRSRDLSLCHINIGMQSFLAHEMQVIVRHWIPFWPQCLVLSLECTPSVDHVQIRQVPILQVDCHSFDEALWHHYHKKNLGWRTLNYCMCSKGSNLWLIVWEASPPDKHPKKGRGRVKVGG